MIKTRQPKRSLCWWCGIPGKRDPSARGTSLRYLAQAMAGLALLAASFSPTPARADTVKAATVDWAPYYGSTLKNGGVIAGLARGAFKAQGHEFEVDFMPWKRAVAMTEKGRYDAVLGAYYTEERAKTFSYSTPFYDIAIGIMAKPRHGIERYDSLKDLTGYTIGYNDGYAYSENFENADYLKKDPASNQTLSVRKFFRDRVDMVAMARGIFRYETSQLKGASLDDVVFLEPPLKVAKLHMMFSPKTDNAEALVADFNAGLTKIKENGTYQEILKAHGF